jgi:ubiquinone/menaquinone biosynthesis C-methylase UbiE
MNAKEDDDHQTTIIQNTNTTVEEDPIQFEDEYVTQVYNHIAPHFSHTRYKAWPYVEKFLLNLPKYSCVADVGCGNGKYMGVNKDVMMFGSDISEGLLNICVERGFESLIANNEHLSYRDNSFVSVHFVYCDIVLIVLLYVGCSD